MSISEIPESKNTKKSILQSLGITHHLVHHKTEFCRHEVGCIENVLWDSLKCFGYGYSAKTLINLLLYLSKIAKNKFNPKDIITIFAAKENFQLPAFISTLTLLFKGVICLSRRFRTVEDWKTPALAGALAGYFSLFCFDKKAKQFLCVFALSRAFDCVYNSLVKNKKIPDSKWNFHLLYCFMISFVVFFYSSQKGIAPSSIEKFFDFVFQDKLDPYPRIFQSQVRARKLIKRAIFPK
jgi:hypothetical protein